MKFLLDTNAVIAVLKGDTSVLARLRAHLPSDFGLPSIVAHELYYGAYKSQRSAENLARSNPCNSRWSLSTQKMRSTLAKFVPGWPPPARRSAPTTR